MLGAETGREVELLAAISGRAWEILEDEDICLQFLECLARNTAGQAAFNQVMVDILFMPTIGAKVREAFRHPQRSETLAAALGGLFKTSHSADQ